MRKASPILKKAVIAVVAGHPSIDRLYEVDQLRPGEIHRPSIDQIQVLPGGKGLNVARAIGRLGGTPHVLGILAGYAGQWIANGLGSEGIEATFVWTAGETRTSISVACTARPGTPSTDFYEHSRPIPPSAWSELESTVTDIVTRTEMLCLSGSLIPGAPVDGYRRLAEISHRAGTPVATDSHGAPLLEALEARPELVKVNAEEAASAVDMPTPETEPLAWATRAATKLRHRAGGQSTCVVTCGQSGMALVDESGAAFRGRLDRIGSYPVGSGDAVLAALAVARISNFSAEDALALALGAGAANAEVPGPGALDAATARAFAQRASVESVRI